MVNWPVKFQSLCYTIAEDVYIVLAFHRITTSMIDKFSTCLGICSSASIFYLHYGMILGSENLGIADQVVCPWTSQIPLVKQLLIYTQQTGGSYIKILECSSAGTTTTANYSLVQHFE